MRCLPTASRESVNFLPMAFTAAVEHARPARFLDLCGSFLAAFYQQLVFSLESNDIAVQIDALAVKNGPDRDFPDRGNEAARPLDRQSGEHEVDAHDLQLAPSLSRPRLVW